MSLTSRQEISALLIPAAVFALLATGAGRAAPAAAAPTPLRVCADPNNLPFSNARGEGFENKIAQLIGQDLHRPVSYTWWAQRRGFVRNTLNAGVCDLVVGTAAGMDMLATTRPYYRSSYVFVTRRDRDLNVKSFDDPRLAHLRIGVQLIGDDFANTPPAHALARRGMTNNLVGFTVYGDYGTPNPPARIVDAVASGAVDMAVVWGPLAGYFAQRERVPLSLAPVSPRIDLPYLPFVFDIAMGVRHADTTFRNTLNDVIVRRRAGIDSILSAYHVPRLDFVSRAGAAE